MKILKKINPSETSRVYIVGDLHGQYDELQRKLDEVGFVVGKDCLISVGDLVDRGPKIKEIIEFIMNTPNCYGVFGNHDNFLLQFDTHPEKWFNDKRNGSESTTLQLGEDNLKKYKKKLLSHFSLLLEVDYRGKKIGVVHAGIPFDQNKPQSWNKVVKKSKRNTFYRANLMWDRTVIRAILSDEHSHIQEVSGVNYVVHGHTTLDKPLQFKNRFYIDTFGKKKELTFLTFDDAGEPYFI